MTQTTLLSNCSVENTAFLPLSGANYCVWVHCLLKVEKQRQIDQELRQNIKYYAKVGDYDQAIAFLTRLISRHPESARDYNNRGLMYFYNQQPHKALQDYNLAITIDPLLDGVYNNRANCYSKLGQTFAALQDYQMALDLNPWNVRALINLGITYRDLGDYSAAIEQLETALFLCKTHQAYIYGERGYIYYLRGDWNCAIADYQRALHYSNNLDYRDKIQERLDQLLGNHQ